VDPCTWVLARGLEEREAGGQRGQEPYPGTRDEEVLAELLVHGTGDGQSARSG